MEANILPSPVHRPFTVPPWIPRLPHFNELMPEAIDRIHESTQRWPFEALEAALASIHAVVRCVRKVERIPSGLGDAACHRQDNWLLMSRMACHRQEPSAMLFNACLTFRHIFLGVVGGLEPGFSDEYVAAELRTLRSHSSSTCMPASPPRTTSRPRRRSALEFADGFLLGRLKPGLSITSRCPRRTEAIPTTLTNRLMKPLTLRELQSAVVDVRHSILGLGGVPYPARLDCSPRGTILLYKAYLALLDGDPSPW